MLERVTQRRRGVDGREHLAPRRLDVGLEPFDLAVRRIVRLRAGREHRRRAVALDVGVGRRHPPRLERGTSRLTSRVERLRLGHDGRDARVVRPRLFLVERDLLLLAIDGELARVGGLARRGGLRLGLDQLDAQPAQIRFDFGDLRGRGRLAHPGVRELRARRRNRLGQLPILARQQDFLAAAQLVAKLLVAPRLAGLPLQRPALLFDLEHDVVDAGQVLPRGFELELRRAAAGLVPGDAGRFFDQLAAIGRPRAQDQANLALLDDGVRLRAEARVHQQLVHVAQAADLAVDQVLALARSVQTPRHFHFARHRLNQFLGLGTCENRILTRDAGSDERNRLVAVAVRPVPIRPVAVMAVAVVAIAVAVVTVAAVAVFVRGAIVDARQRGAGQVFQHAAETQPDFGRRRRLPCVAAAEEHVFHPLAAQALGALLTHHPRDGVGDVALAAAVRPDDGGHALVEGQLRAIGKRFEPVDL